MKAKLYVVRVVQTKDPALPLAVQDWVSEAMVDSLRYAGVIDRIDTEPSFAMEDGTEVEKHCFDIRPPRHISITESKGWAERNAARMKSFGINAVCAPAGY